jgi:holo-[acyl-carrier protein] synthase
MVLGIGIDLVETARISRAIAAHGERFEKRVFTDDERAACRGRRDRLLALAARFAAKEACLKALGTGWSAGLSLQQIEVVREKNGRPGLRLHGASAERARELGVGSVHVSLTHQSKVAAAVVVLEGRSGGVDPAVTGH